MYSQQHTPCIAMIKFQKLTNSISNQGPGKTSYSLLLERLLNTLDESLRNIRTWRLLRQRTEPETNNISKVVTSSKPVPSPIMLRKWKPPETNFTNEIFYFSHWHCGRRVGSPPASVNQQRHLRFRLSLLIPRKFVSFVVSQGSESRSFLLLSEEFRALDLCCHFPLVE